MKATSWEQLKTMIGGMGRALRKNIADALALAKEAKAKADRAQKQFSLVVGDNSSITAKKFNEMWNMTEAELQGAITVSKNGAPHTVTGLYKMEYGEGIEGIPLARHIEMMVRSNFSSELQGYGETICGLYYSKGINNGIKFEYAVWNSSGQAFKVNFDTGGNIIPAKATEEAIKDRNGAAGLSDARKYAITPENLDAAIKYGLIDNRLTLTEEEQQAAQEWLGAQQGDGSAVVPDYWQAHLDERVLDIREALVAAGRNKSSFLWWHDAHWTDNYKKSPLLLKYLYDHTPINKTMYGGDVMQAEDEEINLDTLSYVYDWRDAIRGLPNHHSVIGNHDDGNKSASDGNLPEGFIYSFLLAAEESPNTVYGDGYYYYIDEPAEKTRYLYMDTATRNGKVTSDEAQEVFVREALKSTPRGWHIVAIAHIWLAVDYDASPPVATGFSDDGKLLLDMFDAYNNRTGEYATCGGKVEFCIGAHSHVDNDYTSATGIPVILTECDSTAIRSGLTATAGTITENSVNAIVADYDNKTVHVIRIGRGQSRTVPINHNNAVSYTNQLPIAIDASGATYNGKGYKDNTRVNSSYQDVDADYWDCTGYIPVQIGDVVRFKNCTVYDLDGADTYNRMHFDFFDAAFAWVVSSDGYKTTNHPSEAWSAVHDETTGDLVQVTIPTSYKSSIRYMRITMRDINDNTIITVNEVIE